ncbi:MAG: UDP-4-amino-4-deoxy-L-arabinose aminotransferase [Candidatus Schekmanbacteria bacterium]|nr:UDP-4-amino-4-deoxy-L-arabinose aminotransferase [Candidatus Schekmanbacteria bacterium]
MREDILPFSSPSITADDIEAVAAVMRSRWITTGAKVAAFERGLCDACGAGGAVALASGTAGMHIALTALGIGPGDEVVTPSLTWVSTINLIALAGAAPVFADVDRETLMVTPDTVAAVITDRTRLIVPVHFAGAALDLAPLRALAAARGIALIEDAAHALGTCYRGEPIGRTGTAVLSFHPIKNLTTGEGGAVLSDDPALLERLRRLRFHGLGADAYDRLTQGRSPQAQVQEPGYKYNLTDMAAALGLSQLKRLAAMNHRRAELARQYRELLAEVEEILPLGDPDYEMTHSWHLFIVRVDADRAGIDRDGFMAALKERNVGTGLHFRAAHLHRYYAEQMGSARGSLPHTEWNSDRICSIPLFPDMTDDDARYVVDAIKSVLPRRSFVLR